MENKSLTEDRLNEIRRYISNYRYNREIHDILTELIQHIEAVEPKESIKVKSRFAVSGIERKTRRIAPDGNTTYFKARNIEVQTLKMHQVSSGLGCEVKNDPEWHCVGKDLSVTSSELEMINQFDLDGVYEIEFKKIKEN